MDSLNSFSKLDMLEQITFLVEIKIQKVYEAIPSLIQLCDNDTGLDSIHPIIRHTLRTLLSERDFILKPFAAKKLQEKISSFI